MVRGRGRTWSLPAHWKHSEPCFVDKVPVEIAGARGGCGRAWRRRFRRWILRRIIEGEYFRRVGRRSMLLLLACTQCRCAVYGRGRNIVRVCSESSGETEQMVTTAVLSGWTSDNRRPRTIVTSLFSAVPRHAGSSECVDISDRGATASFFCPASRQPPSHPSLLKPR